MQQIHLIKLLISCPGEIKGEQDSIRLIVEEINKTSGKQNGYSIECLSWFLDTYTDIGSDAQEVINRQVDEEYDILVGILWQRIGTPTKRDKSGTIEEINRAIADRNKKALIYFKTSPPENLNMINIEELSKINLFKKELSEKGVLYKEFNTDKAFESLFRVNITNLIADFLNKQDRQNQSSIDIDSQVDRYSSIQDVISKVEQRSTDDVEDLGVFELSEKLLSALNTITTSLESMTVIVNEFSPKMTIKADELSKLKHIKDDRLRLQKGEILLRLFAGELDDFNNRINQEIPVFSQHFLAIAPLYSKVLLFTRNNDSPDIENMKQQFKSFRDSVEMCTVNTAGMLQQVLQWPPLTTQFSKSKRNTEDALKNLTKEFLEGLKLLDAAIQME